MNNILSFCSGKNRKNKNNNDDLNDNNVNDDNVNDDNENILKKYYKYFIDLIFNKKYDITKSKKKNYDYNVSKIIFYKNNYDSNSNKHINLFSTRLKYPIVSLYEINSNIDIKCNICYKETKEETFRKLKCKHYCHATCLDKLINYYNLSIKKNIIFCCFCNKYIYI